MTKKKRTHTRLSIIIKKRTIDNLHTNASSAKNLSMMHLLRLPTNGGGQKRKRNRTKKCMLNNENDRTKMQKIVKTCVIKKMNYITKQEMAEKYLEKTFNNQTIKIPLATI